LRSPAPSASSKISPSAPRAGGPERLDPNLKRQIIAELKKQTESVLNEVRHATSNFQEVDQLEQVQNLPASVSADVTVVANLAGQCRLVLGQETMLFECLDEIQTVDGITVIDEIARDLAAKDTPTARKKLATFLSRYAGPRNENQKALWRYITSIHSLCVRLKNEAETHLRQARSLESAGKRAEALREYQEIYRIYPNPVTAEKIRQLASATNDVRKPK
jgi:tetratricopeptide (TPR) repeat protein